MLSYATKGRRGRTGAASFGSRYQRGNFHVSFSAASVSQQLMDIYLGPNGDDNNPGTRTSPKSLLWLGTSANYGANGWSTYATPNGGLRVGLLPGTYTQGQVGGVVTTLWSIASASAGIAITLTGGYPGVTGPYIVGVDANGYELSPTAPRQAIIEFGNPATGYSPSPWQVKGIGLGPFGVHNPTNFGNLTLGHIEVRNCTAYGISMGANGFQSLGITVKGCIVRGGRGFHNDNNGGFEFNGCPTGVRSNCASFDHLSVNTTYSGQAQAYFSGTTMTIVSITQGRNLNFINNENLILYDANGNVYNTTVTPQGSGGSNSNGQAGNYTLTQSIGTVGSSGSPVTIYYGWNSSEYPYGSMGYICFNTNNAIGTSPNQNPFRHVNCTDHLVSLDYLKAHLQNYDISYCMMELGNAGSTPGNVPGYPGQIFSSAAPAGGISYFHHNLVMAGSVNLTSNGSATLNAGAVIVHHNTVYQPSTYGGGLTGDPLFWNIGNIAGGSVYMRDNLAWSDIVGSYTGCQVLDTSPTIGMTSDHNVYMGTGSSTPNFMATTNGGSIISLASAQTTYSIETSTQLINSSPFATTPLSCQPNTWALANSGSGLTCQTASSTGGPVGAMDGTGTPGCFFALPLRILNTVPTAAVVGTAYSYTFLTAGGTGPFTFTLLYASPTCNYGGWMSGGNAIDPVNGYPLGGAAIAGTPQQVETGWFVVGVEDSTGYTINVTMTMIVGAQ